MVGRGREVSRRAARLVAVVALGFADVPAIAADPPQEPDPATDTAEPPAVDEPAPERKVVADDNGMLRVPGGTFTMGSDAEPNELPVHTVTVGPFWMDRTEVSVREFRACVTAHRCGDLASRFSSCTLAHGHGDQPVSCVPWKSADEYCRAVGKRLPTEAEWEFAARGTERVRYPWGNAIARCPTAVTLVSDVSGKSCSPAGPAAGGTHPAGASVFGLLDLAGNVEEWVADWYGDRYQVSSAGPVVGPRGPAFGVAHVLRGGGWMSRPKDARVSARNWGSANEMGPNVGFRCAKDGA
jgi:serine/threonine-protein kinase